MSIIAGYLLFSGAQSGLSIVDFADLEVNIDSPLDVELINDTLSVELIEDILPG